ncbi:MAG: cation-translocating P-type ATPase [Polyangiaceae bacterium]|nr:cation-translocating P-type ATPase [Polyangiaceae bacterium]
MNKGARSGVGTPTKTHPRWERFDASAVAQQLDTDLVRGIGRSEATLRRARFGDNVLAERRGRSTLRLLWDQFTSTLVVVLILAAMVSAIVGSLKDTVAILAIVVLNAVLGFVQEARAERAILALKKLAVPTVRVRREGVLADIPASELVPGDLVVLEAGNLVPADGRIVESASLKVQEAMLTGESEAVEKRPAAISEGGVLALGDQANMVFMGTSVAYGRGQMLVTATGMSTELGRVADLLQGVASTATPLQRRLDRLGRTLAVAAVCIVSAIFGVGVFLGEDWRLMFMTSVSMAVAVIPEGLPAVVTISLALGAQRMLRRRALVRRLPAVETLGSVTVVCSDKTGTLTENRMTVTVLDLAGHRLDVQETQSRRMPTTTLDEAGRTVIEQEPSLALLLMGGALCADATLQPTGQRPDRFRAVGDPTEGALVVAAAHFGLLKDQLDAAFPRIGEVPFDSDRKRMSTIHRVADCNAWIGDCAELAPDRELVFAKGAVDALLETCSSVWDGGVTRPLDTAFRERITRANIELAQGGMRVLGVAFRFRSEGEHQSEAERNLTFIGLVGMLDPPRPEVSAAVKTCRQAGIRPVMITGDHPVTARRIAQDLEILGDGSVMTGAELQAFSSQQLLDAVENTSVYARVAPEQKLRIVEALQQRGHVVAMTGDGVNDAPALRRADIGVAMGITGTDVSKEAASMVLLDDNFTTIVAAVEEGRAINDNIRRFLRFSLAGNLGKLALVFGGPVFGMPLPLLPFQILWLNLVTDGVLGLGIGVEPAERGTMQRPPQRPSEGILAGGLGLQIVWQGLLIGVVNLGVALWAWKTNQPEWRSVVMTTVVLVQVFQAQASRSQNVSVFRLSPMSNRALVAATGSVLVLQAAIVFIPPLQSWFGASGLSSLQLGVLFAAGLFVLLVVEAGKLVSRRAG